MATVTHDGRTIAYHRSSAGDGPTVCYVHGAGGGRRLWSGQCDRPDAPPAVAPDLSGHGDSDDVSTPPGRETLEAYADDVVAVCEATDATVLCGNSMGGAVALWIALERDLDIGGIVLADSGAKLGVDPSFLDTVASDFEAAIGSLHAPGTLFFEPTEALVERSTAALRAAGSAVTHRDFETCDAFDVRERLDEIDTPTLALCGEHDPMTPPAFQEYLAETMAECRFREIADAAHLSMLERPAAFNDAVGSFFDA